MIHNIKYKMQNITKIHSIIQYIGLIGINSIITIVKIIIFKLKNTRLYIIKR